MRQTLFPIPDQLAGLPVFGPAGLGSILWALICIGIVAWLSRRPNWQAELKGYLPVMIIIWVALAFVAPMLVEPGFGIPIRGYGVLMLVGVIAGVALAAYRARRMGVDPEIIFSLAFVLFVTAIVGARIFYVLQYWDKQFQADTFVGTVRNVLNVTQGGLVVYGSLIGGLLGGFWYLRRHNLPVLAIADVVAPSLLVGLCIGRIGCLMNGCCYGGLCDRPWAITFPYLSPPYQEQLEANQTPALGIGLREALAEQGGAKSIVIIDRVDQTGIAHGKGLREGAEVTRIDGREVLSLDHALHILQLPRGKISIEQDGAATVAFDLPRSRPVHPTQIYSALNAALLAALLWVAYPFRQRDGVIVALLLTLYPVTRFILEAIRTDEPGRFGTGLTISQLVSLGILAVAAGLWVVIFRSGKQLALPAAKPLTFANNSG